MFSSLWNLSVFIIPRKIPALVKFNLSPTLYLSTNIWTWLAKFINMIAVDWMFLSSQIHMLKPTFITTNLSSSVNL